MKNTNGLGVISGHEASAMHSNLSFFDAANTFLETTYLGFVRMFVAVYCQSLPFADPTHNNIAFMRTRRVLY